MYLKGSILGVINVEGEGAGGGQSKVGEDDNLMQKKLNIALIKFLIPKESPLFFYQNQCSYALHYAATQKLTWFVFACCHIMLTRLIFCKNQY